MLKRLYVICLCLFCAVAARSQNISVASFKMDENDITANMESTMVYDQNGEKCALIRIQTTQTGFTFDVGAPKHKRGANHKPARIFVCALVGLSPQRGI